MEGGRVWVSRGGKLRRKYMIENARKGFVQYGLLCRLNLVTPANN